MIALSSPIIAGNEWKYVKECLDAEWISTAGEYVKIFEEKVGIYTGAKYAIACVNGTSALQISLRLAGVQNGDEVIVPTLTFIAPVNAVAYNGATPIFMDCDDYYNIDSYKTIQFIENETIFKNGFTYNKTTNKKITAIVPVHIWGNAVWLDELVTICEERNIVVVEDASESLGTFYSNGNYSGLHTGTIGKLGCISFNGNKIITTGGGGMIITDDEELSKKAHYLTTQAKDDPVRYIHDEIGYNFRLPNIQAALGVAQLEQLSKFLNRKRDILKHYIEAIKNIDGLEMATVPTYANNNHWINILQIDTDLYDKDLEMIMTQMSQNSIQTRPVWTLNHLQKPYKSCQNYKIEKAVEFVQSSLCLPSSTKLSKEEIHKVVDVLNG